MCVCVYIYPSQQEVLGTRWAPYGQFNGPRMGGPHGRQPNCVRGRHMGYTWVTWAVPGLHYFFAQQLLYTRIYCCTMGRKA